MSAVGRPPEDAPPPPHVGWLSRLRGRGRRRGGPPSSSPEPAAAAGQPARQGAGGCGGRAAGRGRDGSESHFRRLLASLLRPGWLKSSSWSSSWSREGLQQTRSLAQPSVSQFVADAAGGGSLDRRPDARPPRPQGRRKDDNQRANSANNSRQATDKSGQLAGHALPLHSRRRRHRKSGGPALWPLRQRLARAQSHPNGAPRVGRRPFGEPFEGPQAGWLANAAQVSALAQAHLLLSPLRLEAGPASEPKSSSSSSSTAHILASSGFRRRSYDERQGDTDINIIMQPSDFHNIEKRPPAPAKPPPPPPSCLLASWWLRNQQRPLVTNTTTDQSLARSLLDLDYSLTVRLFVSRSALNWNFNSFTFDAICCGRSLSELLLHLFDYYDLHRIFKLNIVNVLRCFRLLEFGYHHSNPYHNSVHAADVTQAMHCFIQEAKIRRHMTHLETLCSIMAAVCHDLDHPGVSQSFLVATNNPLAHLYKSDSVLENHHWRFALCIFKESQLFDHFERPVMDQFKQQLKNLILATDIARQNEYLSRFRAMTSSREFSMRNTQDRALVLQVALKCADLGNPCRPWLISRVWSNLICDEFYRMGRVERQLGLPLTPICQRHKTSIAGIQSDFFRFIVLPLLVLWHQFLQSPLSELLMSNFEHNYQRWQRAHLVVQQLRRRKSIACLEGAAEARAQVQLQVQVRQPSQPRRLSRCIGAQ